MTVPELMLLALKDTPSIGPHRCFYCAAPCGENNPASVHVKDTFTGRNEVPCPGSPWVCDGCVLCLREKADVVLIDGEKRTGQKVRSFSWVLVDGMAFAATKAHLARLRDLCLVGRSDPWAIVLSDSGQKHLLYRGVVNCGSSQPWTVTLEGELIAYTQIELEHRLQLCGRLIAATGKPALAEPLNVRFGIAVLDRYPRRGELMLEQWGDVREEPLTRLALWLSPGKEEAIREYAGDV